MEDHPLVPATVPQVPPFPQGEDLLGDDRMARMLDDYYEERGWAKDSGAPTLEKLKELGLEELAYTLS